MILFLMILLILIEYKHIVNFISSLDISKIIESFNNLNNQFGIIGIIAILTLLITVISLYCYLFAYVKMKGSAILEYDEPGSKYILMLTKIFDIFSIESLIIIFIYLYLIKQSMLEILIVFSILILFSTISRSLFNRYSEIIKDYEKIELMSAYFSLNTDLNVSKGLILPIRLMFKNILSVHHVLFLIPILLIGLGLILNFNILSILILFLISFDLYFSFAVISIKPEGKVDIQKINGEVLKNAYILADSPRGHLLLLLEGSIKIKLSKDCICSTQISPLISPQAE